MPYPWILGEEILASDLNNAIRFGGTGIDGAKIYSSNTTLTEDLYCTDLTVDVGIVLETDGYRIYATGEVIVNGIIQNNGGNGADASGYIGGIAGISAGFNTLGKATAGGNGSIGNCGYGIDGNVSAALDPAKGGSGGDGGSSAGTNGIAGRGGIAGLVTQAKNRLQDLYSAITLLEFGIDGSPLTIMSATGGGGGAGSGNNGQGGAGGSCEGGAGGGGGGGGGIVFIVANKITIGANGKIQSLGGNGGNGDTRYGWLGGGGGGGGGGVVILIHKGAYTNNGVVSVSGGTGGTGTVSGSTGVNGSILDLSL